MRAWIEVPDGWGWGPVRILRTHLEDQGYATAEYRLARGVMIRLTGAGTREIVSPPEWQGQPQRPPS